MRRVAVAVFAVVVAVAQAGQVHAETEDSTPEVHPCVDASNPNHVCGWAMLDEDNNVTNIIVCDYAVCGSGTFANSRVVLQTRQMDDGNVAGYNKGTYSPEAGMFYIDEDTKLEAGARVEDIMVATPPPVTEPETTEPVEPVTEPTEVSVSQAGDQQTKVAKTTKRTVVKKCRTGMLRVTKKTVPCARKAKTRING